MNPEPRAYAAEEDSLFPGCVLLACPHLVDETGDACTECRAKWGPYIHRPGEPSPWPTLWRVSCQHPRWHYRRGRCTLCGQPAVPETEAAAEPPPGRASPPRTPPGHDEPRRRGSTRPTHDHGGR